MNEHFQIIGTYQLSFWTSLILAMPIFSSSAFGQKPAENIEARSTVDGQLAGESSESADTEKSGKKTTKFIGDALYKTMSGGLSGYSIMGSYKDKHESMLQDYAGATNTKLEGYAVSLFLRIASSNLLLADYVTLTTKIPEWTSRTISEIRYGYIIPIFGEIIPTVGVRTVTNKVELTKRTSPVVALNDSRDLEVGLLYTLGITNFGPMQVQGIMGYNKLNPMNQVNVGAIATAELGLHYRPGAKSVMFSIALGAAQETYSASEDILLPTVDTRSVTSTIQAYRISFGGSWR
jgi:hypothetical protein